MSDYISREAAERAAHMAFVRGNDAMQYATMIHLIAKIPAADVVEVRHGSDVSRTVKGHCEFKCSLCGAYALVVEGGTLDGGMFNYCPNCGAKMGGGDGDDGT